MAKRNKTIILSMKKTQVEIKDADGSDWIFDLRYLVNDKETYYCQIIKTDLPGRIERLQAEGFKKV